MRTAAANAEHERGDQLQERASARHPKRPAVCAVKLESMTMIF